MIAHRDIDTPVGVMRAFVTADGLARLTLPGEDRDAAGRELAARRGDALGTDDARTDPVARQLTEYFAGTRREFTLPLDLADVPAFRRDVLRAMAAIPHGATSSYAELAAAAGRPRAVRAAGSACATNPVPVVVPCHRVLRSDGSLGAYGGGLAMKAELLRREGVPLDAPLLPAG